MMGTVAVGQYLAKGCRLSSYDAFRHDTYLCETSEQIKRARAKSEGKTD